MKDSKAEDDEYGNSKKTRDIRCGGRPKEEVEEVRIG